MQKLTNQDALHQILTQLEPLNLREKFNLNLDNRIKKEHKLIATVEEICDMSVQLKTPLCFKDGKVFIYNTQYWSEVDRGGFLKFLSQCGEKIGIPKEEARYHEFQVLLFKQFCSSAKFETVKENKDDEWIKICLQNGIFVIGSEEVKLLPFNMDDFITNQLPFECNSVANAPLFHDFLNFVLPDKSQQDLLQEFCGFIFIKSSQLKLEKALVLLGDGNNGKSVFFDIFTTLLGSANVSNYSLQSLTDSKGYHRAELSNKLLNYASELGSKMKTDIFKQLVSGEPVEARVIYQSPFLITSYAKLMFNANSFPTDVETLPAFFRRFIIINLDVNIPDDKKDPQLAKKIIATELPGVFNWVVEGLKRLLKNKKFSASAIAEKTLEQIKKESDPVLMFLEEERLIPSEKESESLNNIFNSFKAFCRDSGYQYDTKVNFSKRLVKLGFKKTRRQEGQHFKVKKKKFVEGGTLPT